LTRDKAKSDWLYILADIETDGLLLDVTKVHCFCAMDMKTEELRAFSTLPKGTILPLNDGREIPSEPLEDGWALLHGAQVVYGHKWLTYDALVLEKLYGFPVNPLAVRDTLILSKMLWPEIKNGDMGRARKGIMPKKLIGRHGLEAWGYRLGTNKGEFGKDTDWKTVSVEMVSYCLQDLIVNKRLADAIKVKLRDGWVSPKAMNLEHEAALVCERMTVSGFKLDMEKATLLYADLAAETDRLKRELQRVFPPKVQETTFIPKVNRPALGYVKGVPIIRRTETPFNPAAREQIAERLIERYGWKPSVNPETGRTIVDDDTLCTLNYPEVPLIRDYLNTSKILGMVATGRNAWMKLERNGRLHGSVDTMGAITARCTHSAPNVAQTPKVKHGPSGVLTGLAGGFGWECRSLFTSVPGWVMVGTDQAALELRCLGHYMCLYDNGAYIDIVLDGDVHTVNKEAAGLSTRDQAKTFIYGFLYGAGDAKIGEIVLPYGTEDERKAAGKRLKTAFLKGLPALQKLRKQCREAAEEGRIEAIDGRFLPIRKAHAALNTLLQSAGAIACKTWLVIFVKDLLEAGLKWNTWEPEKGDFQLCGFIHDEIQTACRSEHAETIKRIACAAATKAGEALGFQCRLDGDGKIGTTWAETH